MQTLTELEARYDGAQLADQQAREAAAAAVAHAAGLRNRLAGGGSAAADVSADDISRADSAAEYARLVAEGAGRDLPEAWAALQSARVDVECDRITETVPRLGQRFSDALDALQVALSAVEAAAIDYDGSIELSCSRLNTVAGDHPRVNIPRYGDCQVDNLVLAPSRAPSHIAAATLPTLQALGAPQYVLAELRTFAEAAGPILANHDGGPA